MFDTHFRETSTAKRKWPRKRFLGQQVSIHIFDLLLEKKSTKKGKGSPTLGRSVKRVWACEKWIIEALNTTSGWDLMLLSVINENIPEPGQETSALTQVRAERTPPGGKRRKMVGFKRWMHCTWLLIGIAEWGQIRETPFKIQRASSTLMEIR